MLVEPLSVPGAPAARPSRFTVLHGASGQRRSTEQFIGEVYRQHYGARIDQWMPALVSLDDDGIVHAAAGYRAATDPLFLECYLGQPVEAAIAAVAGRPVARGSIVEVGHFASMLPGQGRRLMSHLGRHLADQGFQWVVSTATRELRVIFERLRIRPQVLAAADPRALGDAAAQWGTYYAHAPLVLAGEIRSNLGRFAPAR